MPEYGFHQLSPYDLEVLTRDLLQAHWRVTIESFKSGKERGVDLRYAAGTGKVIVQVKHFAKTGLSGLLRELKSEAGEGEAAAPQSLRCRYIGPLIGGQQGQCRRHHWRGCTEADRRHRTRGPQ